MCLGASCLSHLKWRCRAVGDYTVNCQVRWTCADLWQSPSQLEHLSTGQTYIQTTDNPPSQLDTLSTVDVHMTGRQGDFFKNRAPSSTHRRGEFLPEKRLEVPKRQAISRPPLRTSTPLRRHCSSCSSMGKRKQREDDEGPAPSSEPASIGQQTSHIANKQKRSAAYSKLKHKKEVCSVRTNTHDSHSNKMHMLGVGCRKPSEQKGPSGRQQLPKRSSWAWSPQLKRFPRSAFTCLLVSPRPNQFAKRKTDCAANMQSVQCCQMTPLHCCRLLRTPEKRMKQLCPWMMLRLKLTRRRTNLQVPSKQQSSLQ